MRAADIETGVVYAYQTNEREDPYPVVVVDLRVHAQPQSPPRLSNSLPLWTLMPEHVKPHGARHAGLPAVTTKPPRMMRGERGSMAHLTKVTYDHVAASMTRSDYSEAVIGYSVYPVVLQPRCILGPWEAVSEKVAAEQELESNLAAIELDRKQALTDTKQSRIDALRVLGLPGEIDDAPKPVSFRWSKKKIGEVTLTIAQVDALLALIPDGARAPRPDDAEWEYVEGQR